MSVSSKLRVAAGEHLTREQVGDFVHDPSAKKRLRRHVLACRDCLQRVLLRNRRCAAVRPRFEELARGTLRKNLARDASYHLEQCQNCFAAYLGVVGEIAGEMPEPLREVAPAPGAAIPKLPARIAAIVAEVVRRAGITIDVVLGRITGISALQPFAPAALAASGASRAGGSRASRRAVPPEIQSWRKGGVEVILTVDAAGKLVAEMKSAKYGIEGVNIAIGLTRRAGFEAVAEAVTNRRGVARLGAVSKLPRPATRSGYRVRISGLKAKVT